MWTIEDMHTVRESDEDEGNAADKNPTMIYWNIVSVISPGRRALAEDNISRSSVAASTHKI